MKIYNLNFSILSLVSALWIFVVLVLALFASLLAPYSYSDQYLDQVLVSPNSTFWLGTDSLGRDMLSRLIFGSRVSMAVGILTAIVSLLLGTAVGLFAGWRGGAMDRITMRLVDILDSVPTLVLMILIKLVFDASGLFQDPQVRSLVGLLAALSLVSWVALARVVRSQVLQVKQMAFVESSVALGSTSLRTVFRQVLPNILSPMIVLLTFQVPSNILSESFMSFLGLGLQPPYASWGVLASDGWRSLRTFPHLMAAPGLVIFVTMLAFNFFGDALRDALDPQLRGRK